MLEADEVCIIYSRIKLMRSGKVLHLPLGKMTLEADEMLIITSTDLAFSVHEAGENKCMDGFKRRFEFVHLYAMLQCAESVAIA